MASSRSTGWVDSYTKRWAAEEAAHRVRGVKAVANDIEVRLGVGGDRTDPEIAAAAARALQWDALLVPENIDVTVSKGWVTLKGTVDWQYKKQEAERVVRNLAGVKGVSNLIEVKPKAQPSDIKRQVEQALVRSAQTDAERITVEVDGSKVILKGTVRVLGRAPGGGAGRLEGARHHAGRQPHHGRAVGGAAFRNTWQERERRSAGRHLTS